MCVHVILSGQMASNKGSLPSPSPQPETNWVCSTLKKTIKKNKHEVHINMKHVLPNLLRGAK